MMLFLDVTRLATRMFLNAPTGIDRVEYAYAKELLQDRGVWDAIGVVTTPLFAGALRKARSQDMLRRVERAWGLAAGPDEDAVLAKVKAWLSSSMESSAEAPRRFFSSSGSASVLRNVNFFRLRDLARASTRLGRWVDRSAAEPSVYFHCSQSRLDKIGNFGWLARKRVPSVFFLHDAIPVEFPEFCSAGGHERHIARLTTVSKLASLILVNSMDSRRAVRSALQARHARVPEIEVVPLGVGDWFLPGAPLRPPSAPKPYFLCVGTIEPRKNLLFLLVVWRRLVERLGTEAPRLVLAGRRGWENENVLDILGRSRTLAPFVAEASDLSDAGLASLMAGAAGLLAPSFSEGFGLPIVESLSVGAPVVASDIAAHREVGGDFALYADPLDGPAWVSAIEELAEPNSELSARLRGRSAAYRPLTWRSHVDLSMKIFERVERTPGPVPVAGTFASSDEGRSEPAKP